MNKFLLVLICNFILLGQIFSNAFSSPLVSKKSENDANIETKYSGIDVSKNQVHLQYSILNYGEFGTSFLAEYTHKTIAFTLSYVDVEEFNVFVPSPTETTKEFGFLIGKSLNYMFGYFSFSGGIAYTNLVRRGVLQSGGYSFMGDGREFEHLTFEGLGVPLKISIVLKIANVGIGLHFTLNMNKLEYIFGFSPTIYVGTYNKPQK